METASCSGRQQGQREPVFDVVKFLLIFWVVWGHLQSTGFVSPSHGYFELFFWRAKVINMPAFLPSAVSLPFPRFRTDHGTKSWLV